MSLIAFQNGSFPVKRGEIPFYEGQKSQSVNILLQGKLEVFISSCDNISSMTEAEVLSKSFRIFNIEQNVFIGAGDLFQSGSYSFSYRASEDSNIYVYSAGNAEQVKELMSSQKDYGAYMIASISSLIHQSRTALTRLEQLSGKLAVLADNLNVYFWLLKEKLGFPYTPASKYSREGLELFHAVKEKLPRNQGDFNPSLLEADLSELFDSSYLPLTACERHPGLP